MVNTMDIQEVNSVLKKLQAAIAEKQPGPSVIAILENLKNGVVATEDMLRTTKAGIIVSKLKVNPNKEIARTASELVAKWRATVQPQKKPKVAGGVAASSPKNASSPAPTPAAESKGYKGDPKMRKWNTDMIDVKRTGMPTRDNCIGLMYNGLAFMNGNDSPQTIIIKAMEVEAAAFKKYNGETQQYKDKLRSLYQNLKNLKNRELAPRVLSGEIAADRFVVMSHEELASKDRKLEDEKLEKENMMKAQVPMAEKSISDALKCGKCHQKKVSYSQAQTRSADEPMTTFCECTVCGNRWKFS